MNQHELAAIGETFGNFLAANQKWASQDDDIVRLNARIDCLEKALDQAIQAGSLMLNRSPGSYPGYGMWKYENEPEHNYIVGQSMTEGFFGGYSADCPELAAELKRMEGK